MSTQNIKTWDEFKTALTEDIDNPKVKQLTGAMLENGVKELSEKHSVSVDTVRESLLESGSAGSSTSGNFDRYDRLFMPLVRRVTPALMATELVGTQPMNGPTGMIRTLRFRYSTDIDESEQDAGDGVEAGTEASGTVVYDRYSKIALGDQIDASDNLNPFEQMEKMEGDPGNRMSLDVVKKTIEAKTRKLSAIWSREADQDARALDGLNIESEMVTALSDEIVRELDRELLAQLDELAGITDSFDYAEADGRYAGEKFTALTIGFSDLSNRIAIATKRGGASWMVVSPNLLVVLRNASNGAFQPAAATQDISPRQSLFAGTLNGSIRVYVDLYAEDDKVMLGYKGSSELDTGFVYAPYIPMMSSGVVHSPDSFDPRINLMTRYAFASFTDPNDSLANSGDYYAKATITDLKLGF